MGSDILCGTIFWHSFWHSIQHLFWHSLWHLFRHSFWHISGIDSDILSDMLSRILFGICSAILSGILSDILSGVWLRSGSAHWNLAPAFRPHWDLALAVEARVPTDIWSSRMKSGSAHHIRNSQLRSQATGREGEEKTTLIKSRSRDPHLAGGENLWKQAVYPHSIPWNHHSCCWKVAVSQEAKNLEKFLDDMEAHPRWFTSHDCNPCMTGVYFYSVHIYIYIRIYIYTYVCICIFIYT